MPRHARIDAPGAVHHVMVRGIAREAIFYDDTDKDRFLDRVGNVLSEQKAFCYAFALLSNHVHLVLRTGTMSIADVMRRLLTGYAVSFNKRHKRSGHLFQNRYKSILCEEEPYLLELVRYVHLNPLRVRLVQSLDLLDPYPYSGHSTLVGRYKRPWLDAAFVLKHFSLRAARARRLYRSFVESGISQGRRKDLTGGGFVRSNQGWRPGEDRLKSDERILGSSDFVTETLRASREAWERSHALKESGVDFIAVRDHTARLFGLDPEDILLPGKYPSRVAARSVLCWFCVRGLGMTCTALAAKLMIGQPAVSIAVARGEKIAKERGLRLPEERK